MMSRSPSASDYKLQDEELSPTVQGLSKRPGHAPSVPAKFADESFKLFASIGPVEDSTPEEARGIKRRATLVVLPFLCVGYHLMYLDKQILGSQSILGILEDAHLSSGQYNWLVSIFYFGYLIAELPQNYALQRFPLGKWLGGNLLVWTVLILSQMACRSFGSLFALRFLLGISEACVVPAFLITLNMFFTHDESATLMPIMWAAGNSSPISNGLLSYAVLHINKGGLAHWEWFSLISGVITFVYAVLVILFFPDSPTSAWFFTPKERAQSILRIRSNHEGIEQKTFKRSQMIEAFKDPKTWLFFLHAWAQEMANGTTSQYSLIIKSFGFTTLQTTLLGCVSGLSSVAFLLPSAWLLARTKNCRAYLAAAAYLPAILSTILLLTLPFSNRWGLLSALWIRSSAGVPYAVVMNWGSSATSGHTKKVTVNALYHVGYGLGNILSPQLFQPQYKPRYLTTWWVILWVACVFPMFLVLYIRWYLQRENKRRDLLSADQSEDDLGVVIEIDENGQKVERTVSDNQLDLTDRQNLNFRYVL